MRMYAAVIERLRPAVGTTARIVVLLSRSGHAAELVLSGEVLSELSEGSYKLLAHVYEHLAGSDCAVGLKTDQDLGDVGMGNYVVVRNPNFDIITSLLTFVASHHHVRVLLEVLSKQVANGVVFLENDEIRGV